MFYLFGTLNFICFYGVTYTVFHFELEKTCEQKLEKPLLRYVETEVLNGTHTCRS